MILHGIFESRFESEEALVDGCGILAVERDHLGPRFAASDDLERLDDGVGDSRGRFACETESGSGPVRLKAVRPGRSAGVIVPREESVEVAVGPSAMRALSE